MERVVYVTGTGPLLGSRADTHKCACMGRTSRQLKRKEKRAWEAYAARCVTDRTSTR